MNAKHLLFFTLFTSLSVISSCTKDEIICPHENSFCIAETPYASDYTLPTPLIFQTAGSALGYTFLYNNTSTSYAPCFNPNNPNQFCFLMDSESPLAYSRVCTFDLCSGELKTLTNTMGFNPQWSKTNWICFYTPNGQTWKIKSTGDSLQQMTFTTPYNTNAVWNADGTKFCYSRDNPQAIVISDLNSNTVDSIANFQTLGSPKQWKWNKNDLIAFTTYDAQNPSISKIMIYSFSSKQTTEIFRMPEYWAGYRLGFCQLQTLDWLNENEIIVSDIAKIYKINIQTKQVDILLSGADNYSFLFVSANSNKYILLDLQTFTQVTRDTLHSSTSLAVWDIEKESLKKITPP